MTNNIGPDDDEFLRTLKTQIIPLLEDTIVVKNLKVFMHPDLHALHSIVLQWQSIKNVPNTDLIRQELHEELQDMASTLEAGEEKLIETLKTLPALLTQGAPSDAIIYQIKIDDVERRPSP